MTILIIFASIQKNLNRTSGRTISKYFQNRCEQIHRNIFKPLVVESFLKMSVYCYALHFKKYRQFFACKFVNLFIQGGKVNFVKSKKTCQSKWIQVIGQRFYGRGPPIPISAATLELKILAYNLDYYLKSLCRSLIRSYL